MRKKIKKMVTIINLLPSLKKITRIKNTIMSKKKRSSNFTPCPYCTVSYRSVFFCSEPYIEIFLAVFGPKNEKLTKRAF